MEGDNIENLYKYYGILADAKDRVKEHEDIYKEILRAAKGTAKERKLVCQFIPRFFAHFPELGNDAINAHFDLCEDSDLSIRKQAIKELPSFCRECTDYTRRVSDILAQLLQATEPTELTVVRTSLLSLFKIDPRATLLGIFNQIKNGDDRVREKCIDFIMTKVRDLPSELFTNDVQDIFISEIKNVFQDASSDEIPIFFDLLLWTRLGKTTLGKKQILDAIIHQLESEKAVNTDDEYIIERFLAFVKTAKGLFSTEICSNKFLIYCCEEIVPKFNSITGCSEGSGNALEVLKLLAEISCFVKDLKDASSHIDAVFSLLLEYLPLPTEDEGVSHQKLQFSYVECLLTTFHVLMKENPDYLSSDLNKLKDFRIRLQYFARASQVYVKTLDEIVKKNKKEDLDNMDNRIKMMALKTISNINVLIKDFFHNPPSYKSTIKLSWLSVIKSTQKRKIPAEPTRVEKQPKAGKSFHQEIYQPPNGKYSSNLFDSRRGKPVWF